MKSTYILREYAPVIQGRDINVQIVVISHNIFSYMYPKIAWIYVYLGTLHFCVPVLYNFLLAI